MNTKEGVNRGRADDDEGPFLRSSEACINSHLHVLQEGSKVEERHLDGSIELCLGCVQELFKGRHGLQVIFSPLFRLAHASILQQGNSTNKVAEVRNMTSSSICTALASYLVHCCNHRLYYFDNRIELFTCLTWRKSSLHRPFISRSCCLSSSDTVSSHVSMRKLPASFMAAC